MIRRAGGYDALSWYVTHHKLCRKLLILIECKHDILTFWLEHRAVSFLLEPIRLDKADKHFDSLLEALFRQVQDGSDQCATPCAQVRPSVTYV